MPGLEEGTTVWRYRVQDPSKFDKFRVKELGKGVKITLGKVKDSDRWIVQNYMFEKTQFSNRENVREWLETHLKKEIRSMLDYRAWNEWRKRCLAVYLEISGIK
jgi:hypothetical protein